MFHRTPFFLPFLYGSLTWRIPTEEKELYLTFDDGPVEGPTAFVLDVLERYQAKATFFCIGDNIRKHAQVFRKIVDHGHAIGNHTYNHLNGWKTRTADYLQNVKLCDLEIESHLSGTYKNPLFRPPYGRIGRRQITALSEFKIIMWDVLSMDYNKNLSSQHCLKNTIAATRRGSIIVFHDSYKAEKHLTYVLPRFVEHYSSLGFTFKSIV